MSLLGATVGSHEVDTFGSLSALPGEDHPPQGAQQTLRQTDLVRQQESNLLQQGRRY